MAKLCSSRKYPYLPPRRGIFLSPSTPLEILIELHTFLLKSPGLIDTSPLHIQEIPIRLVGAGDGCDWLPKWVRWSYPACLGLPGVPCGKHFPKTQILNPLLAMLGQSGWLDIGIFGEFMDVNSISVHKHTKKELDKYPAIFTSHLVNNPYLLSIFQL